MKSHFLFSSKFKAIGFVLFLVGTILGILYLFNYELFPFLTFNMPSIYSDDILGPVEMFRMYRNNITDELIGMLIIVGGILLGFSKEEIEDEYSTQLRLDALVWSVYLNYAILIFMMLFVYNAAFLSIMVYNLFTIIYFFNIRYYYLKWKASKLSTDEK